jgi:hypothetical protein
VPIWWRKGDGLGEDPCWRCGLVMGNGARGRGGCGKLCSRGERWPDGDEQLTNEPDAFRWQEFHNALSETQLKRETETSFTWQTWTGLTGQSVLAQDSTVRSDAEFHRLMLDGLAGAMTCRCQGEELVKSAEIGRTLAHFGAPAETVIENSQSHGALAFMGMQLGAGSSWARFLVRGPLAHRRER